MEFRKYLKPSFALMVLLILAVNIGNVRAYSTISFDLPSNYVDGYFDNQNCYLSSGRFVQVYGTYALAGTYTYNVKSYLSNGVLDGDYSFSVSRTDMREFRSIAVAPWNSTFIVVMMLFPWADVSTNGKYYYYAELINIVSGLRTSYSVSSSEGTSWTANRLGKGISYIISGGNLYYVVIIAHEGTTTGTYLKLLKFTGSAITVLGTSTLGAYQANLLFPQIFVDNYTANNAIILAQTTDYTTPVYYSADLSTGTISSLATSSIASTYTNDKLLKFIGGGVWFDTSTNYYWVWFDWARPYLSGSSRRIAVYQHRLVFNNSITSAMLLSQNERLDTEYPDFYGTHATNAFCFGYLWNRTTFDLWYPSKLGVNNVISKVRFQISSFTDTGSSTLEILQYVSDSGEIVPYVNDYDAISRIATGTFQVEIDTVPSPDKMYIYYDLDAIAQIWTLGTFTYSPNDYPNLKTNTNYDLSSQTFLNGVGFASTVRAEFDGVSVSTKATDSTGHFTFTISTNLNGAHSLVFTVYSNSSVKLVSGLSLVFVDLVPSGNPTPQQTMLININQMMSYIIPSMFILIPAIIFTVLFAKLNPMIGFMIGASLGVLIGVASQQIGLFAVVLIGMLDAICLVFLMKNGNNNGA